MAYGFVYVLSNPSMPGIYKIGYTLKHPNERMAELSKATACPSPFEMLAFFDSKYPEYTEREIHLALDAYRVNPGREFFNAPVDVIQNMLRKWVDTFEGIFYSDILDNAVDRLLWQRIEAENGAR